MCGDFADLVVGLYFGCWVDLAVGFFLRKGCFVCVCGCFVDLDAGL